MISLRTVTKWRNVMAPGFGFDTLGMLSDFVSMRRIRCSTTAVSWPATQFACIAMVDVAVMRFVLPDIHDALPIVLQASHQWALLVMQTMTPYIFIGAARMIAYIIADQVFPRGVLMQQQDIRTRTSDSGTM